MRNMNESPFLTYSSSAFSRRLTFNHNNRTFEQQSLHPLCSSNRASSFTFQPLPAPPSRDTISTEQYRHWLDRKTPDSTTPLYVSSSLLLQIKRRRRGGRKLERFEHSDPLHAECSAVDSCSITHCQESGSWAIREGRLVGRKISSSESLSTSSY